MEDENFYRTGDSAPVSGVYRFVRSSDPDCEPTDDALEIPLGKGELFPPHLRCNKLVEWELIGRA